MVLLLERPAGIEALSLELEKKPTFGDWVRQMREARGLSLRELARRAGVTHPTLSGIQSGERGATRDMVRAIADGLDVPRADAVRAWLEDEEQEGGAITYMTDPDAAGVVETYEGLNEVNRDIARTMMEKLRDAQSAASTGGGGGRSARNESSRGAEDTGTDG